MKKPFSEALADGFIHTTDITDPDILSALRSEGIDIDTDGFWSYLFGDHKEFELRVEPIFNHGQYQIALYHNNVLLTEKLLVKALEATDLEGI